MNIRTTRTLKVTDVRVSPQEQELLSQLAHDARYEALLNVMERACIELETAHFNTEVKDPEAVLGGHCLAKGTWLFFQYVQKQVVQAYTSRTVTENDQSSEPPSLDDVLQGIE